MTRKGPRNKTSPLSSGPRSSSAAPAGVARWLLAGGILLVIGGLGLLAWARTPLGQAALLRLGSSKMFVPVQEAVDAALGEALAPYLAEPWTAKNPAGGDAGGASFPDMSAPAASRQAWPLARVAPGAAIICRTVSLPEAISFWEIQAKLRSALRTVGGQVLWSERVPRPGHAGSPELPDEQSDLLRLDLGVAGRPTHTLVLFKAYDPTPHIQWGAGEQATAWSLLTATSPQPTVALVLDDWGYFENEVTTQLLTLDVPLTLSVLPGLPFSRRFALEATDLALPPELSENPAPRQRQARYLSLRQHRLARGCPVEFHVAGTDAAILPQRRRQILLHLPMEPEDPQWDPGPQAITVGMSSKKMEEIIDAALTALPHVTGVNNHMGSRATADRATMDRVMKLLAQRGLLFLDSLTTPHSVAAEAAARVGIPALHNRIFLDQREPSREQIRKNLARLIQAARQSGFAVGIGHPYAETLAVLSDELPRWQREGVRFVTLSELAALRRHSPGSG